MSDSKWPPNSFEDVYGPHGECHACHDDHHVCMVHLLGCTEVACRTIRKGRVPGAMCIGKQVGVVSMKQPRADWKLFIGRSRCHMRPVGCEVPHFQLQTPCASCRACHAHSCNWATATARPSKEILAQESFSSTPTQGISSHGVLSMSEDATQL